VSSLVSYWCFPTDVAYSYFSWNGIINVCAKVCAFFKQLFMYKQ